MRRRSSRASSDGVNSGGRLNAATALAATSIHVTDPTIIEGDTVLSYYASQFGGGAVYDLDATLYEEGQLISSGYISIQAESHGTQFRKIEVLELD